MAEKRKPDAIWLLRRKANKYKTTKVEIFNANKWEDGIRYRKGYKTDRYRIRVKGKWFEGIGGQKYFSKTEFKNIFWKSVKL